MSERVRPSRDQAHLIVAAVRVLAHREASPPNVHQVGELLGLAPEPLAVTVRELVSIGILREVTDAYGARLEIGDTPKIETLEEGGGPAMQSEIRTFTEKRRERDEALRQQFASDLSSKGRERFSKLEEDLKKFRSSGGAAPRTNMWGEPTEDAPRRHDDDEDR
jgi:hypothetical protein